jgi:bifunctional UDP-N-acetylglucosamine pyrophosphorylase/glucosamine-1-phosphate N-acetyltransferase
MKTLNSQIAAVVLAGGKGTRMQATLPKVLHTIADQPMIYYTLDSLKALRMEDVHVVVGHQAEEVKQKIKDKFNCNFSYQPKPLGTANAVKHGIQNISPKIKDVLVLNGDDSAFYKISTLEKFISSHLKSGCPVSMMTLVINRDRKLGRVIRDKNNNFQEIIEATLDEVKSFEINCGLYLFNLNWLCKNMPKIKLNDKGEYFLTDIFNIAKEERNCVNLFLLKNKSEWVGVNTPDELLLADKKMQKKLKK